MIALRQNSCRGATAFPRRDPSRGVADGCQLRFLVCHMPVCAVLACEGANAFAKSWSRMTARASSRQVGSVESLALPSDVRRATDRRTAGRSPSPRRWCADSDRARSGGRCCNRLRLFLPASGTGDAPASRGFPARDFQRRGRGAGGRTEVNAITSLCARRRSRRHRLGLRASRSISPSSFCEFLSGRYRRNTEVQPKGSACG